jgi:hypothetical protein
MDALHYTANNKRSPLQQAKTRERVATYSIALIVGIVLVLTVSTIMVASSESPSAQARLMSAVIPVAQLIVSLATLALVQRQMSSAVRDVEQAEETASRLAELTDAVRVLQDAVRNPARAPQEQH